jgi:hypothetical protein
MIFLAVDVDRQTVPKNVISPSRGWVALNTLHVLKSPKDFQFQAGAITWYDGWNVCH